MKGLVRPRGMPTKLILSLVTAAVLAAALAVPAAAHHRRPPAAKLVSGDTIQWGNLGTYCWSYSDPGEAGGTGMCADTFGYDWPRAKPAQAGARVRIRFRIGGCPNSGTMRWWAVVDADGRPVGSGETVAYRERPMRRNGAVVACRLVFRLPERVGHFYLDLFVDWDDSYRFADGGTGGGGDAQYNFHLKLREGSR